MLSPYKCRYKYIIYELGKCFRQQPTVFVFSICKTRFKKKKKKRNFYFSPSGVTKVYLLLLFRGTVDRIPLDGVFFVRVCVYFKLTCVLFSSNIF